MKKMKNFFYVAIWDLRHLILFFINNMHQNSNLSTRWSLNRVCTTAWAKSFTWAAKIIPFCTIPIDTGRKLNVHKTFRRRPGRLLNVLCTFDLRPVSTGVLLKLSVCFDITLPCHLRKQLKKSWKLTCQSNTLLPWISSLCRGVAREFKMEGRDWETLDVFFQIVYLLLTVTPV